jgi:parallel beta-helix repeat protein
MKKLIYLIIVMIVLGLIISGCIPVVPPAEQSNTDNLTKAVINVSSGDSIQLAIDAASNYDTINVAAGTYAGFTVNKPLTLLGAQANVDPAGSVDRGTPGDGDESVIVGTVTITADDVTVNGFKTGYPINAGYNHALNVNISYNISVGADGHWGAIHLHGGGGAYNQCDFAYIGYNTISDTTSPDWQGGGIWTVGNDDVTIEHNHILNSQYMGIFACNHVGDRNTILHNTITNSGHTSIRFWGGSEANISYNVIDGAVYDGIWVDSAAGNSIVSYNHISNIPYAGINIREGCTNALITYNDISGCGTGVDVVGTVTGTVINFNEIYGNDMGVANYDSTVTVYAEYNWWGDVSGPYDPLDTDDLNQYNPGGLGDPVTEYVLYDPWIGQGGMVTGGGWIYSPAGAYTANPELEGKATFGFVSMYKKGADVPTGKTQFNFQVADLNFHSDSYDWLVITGGQKAMYKGTGTVNGADNFGFMLSAIDDDPDKFRIKIWDKGTDTVIYDNKQDGEDGTVVVGGQIVIHKRK